MSYKQLKLENQLCFRLYAASHLITRQYKPYLDELGITYPQYLVFMVLWEHENLTVNVISKKLLLNTNTVTPLLKRMETQGWLYRERSKEDERKVIVKLSQKGSQLKEKAADIPISLAKYYIPDVLSLDEFEQLKSLLDRLILDLSE
ncbi:MAG: MarR family transcriptional regulator [Candidatus Neomarinimicrobiota bacterium]